MKQFKHLQAYSSAGMTAQGFWHAATFFFFFGNTIIKHHTSQERSDDLHFLHLLPQTWHLIYMHIYTIKNSMVKYWKTFQWRKIQVTALLSDVRNKLSRTSQISTDESIHVMPPNVPCPPDTLSPFNDPSIQNSDVW